MKNLLIILFINFSFLCFGQVPNTGTFDLDTVVDVVVPTTNDLVDCFSDAITGYFDPTYSGSKDRLSNFRNYGGTSIGYKNTGGADYVSSASSIDISFPLTDEGDFLIMTVSTKNNRGFTTPSSWTQITSPVSNANMSFAWYYIVADGDETGNQTVSITGGNDSIAGIIYGFEGVNTSDPFSSNDTPSIGFGNTWTEANSAAAGELGVALYSFKENVTFSFTGNEWIEDYNSTSATYEWCHANIHLNDPPSSQQTGGSTSSATYGCSVWVILQ